MEEEREIEVEKSQYFFDTYPVIEILNDNSNFERFREIPVIFTIFNLAELYYSVLNSWGEEKANVIFESYKDAVVEIDDNSLKEAMKFRKENKKRDVSYTDCIGYVYAKRNGLKFLTGDKEFENMPNVEFVK
jgi:uncharacterized protein